MSRLIEELKQDLASLAAQGLQRRHRVLESPQQPVVRVEGREVVAFCSNDYLGLANDPAVNKAFAAGVKKWGSGAGASHLINGHLKPHEDLEQQLAAFVGMDKALLFSTGYMANLGIVSALVGRGDAIFADRLNHASLIDAAQLSRADHQRYQHADIGILKGQLAASSHRKKLIVTDGVFSMDGDIAPLPALLELAEKHDAWLLIDDAHGFGTLGEHGRGILEHFGLPHGAHSPRILYMGTLGKAAGVAGAFVAGNATVIDWLLQTARTHIFTTASPAAQAVALQTSLILIENGQARRAHLNRLIEQLRHGLQALPWELLPSPTAIQPIIVGSNDEALRLSQGLLDAGIWVPAIRPPTVPAGKARLRITLSAAHSEAQVDGLLTALRQLAVQEPAA